MHRGVLNIRCVMRFILSAILLSQILYLITYIQFSKNILLSLLFKKKTLRYLHKNRFTLKNKLFVNKLFFWVTTLSTNFTRNKIKKSNVPDADIRPARNTRKIHRVLDGR